MRQFAWDGAAFESEVGALGFRDFPGLPAAKENRNDSRRTLPAPTPYLKADTSTERFFKRFA
jgi:hypothetical protein